MSFVHRFVLSAFLVGLAHGAAAAADLLDRLAEPRTHAIMRHALAPGTGDPADFDVEDCATQRNLDDRGRKQARETGRMLREAGVRIDRVLSSRWCRCLETARLLEMGEVGEEPALNSFFQARERREAQTATLRRLLAEMPTEETALLVTHQVNITALTGVFPRSGQIVVFRAGPEGGIEVLGSVDPR